MASEQLNFEEFLTRLRNQARNTTEQGTQFEIAMTKLLPQLPEFNFENAWLWKDWPERQQITGLNAQDIGIDIVARVRDRKEYHAIQCKFYDPDSTISHTDLGTFYTSSGREGFSGRLIITTTDNWTSTAEEMMKDQQIETHRYRLQDLRDLKINWNWVRPDKTYIEKDKKTLFPRQKEALDNAIAHYAEHDRGQLIMACGTGKTYTSLKIAEAITPENGSVLFVVPSLSLMKQTITEWARERERDTRYLGICSDDTVGNQDEEATHIADITVPVTTDPNRIAAMLNTPMSSSNMTVTFCTYQSLDRLSLAHNRGVEEFDLIICDEAHRTTGVDKESKAGSNQKNSNFVQIHNQSFIKGKKRLYMTATPRIYTEQAHAQASKQDVGVFSMDDENQYGKEFFKLGFGKAVDEGLLSDYRVIVFTMAQKAIAETISTLDKNIITEIDASTDDVAKIIGCYKALRDQGKDKDGGIKLKRAVSFSSSIKNSKMVVDKFTKIVKAMDDYENDGFTCELEHVDGKQTALMRSNKIDWLSQDVPAKEDGEVCRILSNARCLTEGVDVPSLDAIMFMNPRRSQVDVVQAVGRVMRKAKNKNYGYVILPVVIPEGEDIEDALKNNAIFGVVWDVLRALRAHDDRLTNYISKLELNHKKPDNISVIGVGFSEDDKGNQQTQETANSEIQLQLAFPESLAGLIYAKIVDKVGDKGYLEQWAKDTAKLHDMLVTRIDNIRINHAEIHNVYDQFLDSLKSTIHDGLNESDASSMLAQQLITRPIFDVLFDGYQFSQNNVISIGLNGVLEQLENYGLDQELDKLKGFYESVSKRVNGLDNDNARQKVIIELYEKFFTTAFPKTAESLGIAYTPIDVVDFTIKSADAIMREEFGRGLTDEGVHIIDPFTGTGSFLVQLLNNPDIIKDSDLHRKFTSELWANEILLLAYYIASVNIEMAHHHREGRQYQTFPGISLTDTFELYEQDEVSFPALMQANSKRIDAQRKAPIRVVMGNPPWSGGQKSQNDNNANRKYPALDKSISNSYVKRSNANNSNAVYDSYIRSIRWASDRIGKEGMVAFVTNGGWLEGASTDGMRLCLEDEFDTIRILDLRGDIRKNISTKGKAKEGGNIFGNKSQNRVCISFLIKNPAHKREKAIIQYHDIGDDLSQNAKMEILREADSISGCEWKAITPNGNGDWLNQRDPLFQTFIELGNDAVKRGKISAPETIFRSFSGGVKTNRDAWAYNFNQNKMATNMEKMIDFYNQQIDHLAASNTTDIDKVLSSDPTCISWDGNLKDDAKKGKKGQFDASKIVPSLYRPFTMEWLYFDRKLNSRVYLQPSYFPDQKYDNQVICVSGKGAASEFSCLMTDSIPNLHTLDTGQTFPRWVYHKDKITGDITREDNITEHALRFFQNHYNDVMSKDDIFHYVYGILHAPDYKSRFATDLRLGLPRIPMASDFLAFSDAGSALAHLHQNWPLNGDPLASTDLGVLLDDKPVLPDMMPSDAYIVKKMKKDIINGQTFITYNKRLKIGPIPANALTYTIAHRTPLEWIIDRYQMKTDKASGIVNNPNDWIAEQGSDDALIRLIKRVTYLSQASAKIIADLPKSV